MSPPAGKTTPTRFGIFTRTVRTDHSVVVFVPLLHVLCCLVSVRDQIWRKQALLCVHLAPVRLLTLRPVCPFLQSFGVDKNYSPSF
jgi:hypothetical protein